MNESHDFFERLEQQLTDQLPFVAYRKPNSDEVKAMFQLSDKLHKVSDYKESGFVFAPFDDREDAVLIPLDVSETISFSFVIPAKARIHLSDEEVSSQGDKHHINLVKKGIDAISHNYLKKVVLSRRETVSLSEANPINLFKKLLQTYPTAFVYCWYHPKIGLWLGATPETLLRTEGNRFETMALAGTQLYKGTLDVIWEAKEKEEQQLVTDYVVNNLQPSVDSLNVSEAKTVKAGKLLHLQTEITGTFNFQQSNFKNLLGKLHPTPAICGIPKKSSKQFIIDNEFYFREFYTGFLGELNIQEKKTRNSNRRNVENNAYASVKKVSNLYVNLRCMQIQDNEAIIYVGGGITKDSIPENEWIETVNKTNTMKKVLS